MTQAGIKPVTFRFVAQHLNHCATAYIILLRTVAIEQYSDYPIVSADRRGGELLFVWEV